VELASEAENTKNYSELDKIIKCKIKPFLYNEGNGKQLPTREIIRYRSRSRQNFSKVSKDMSEQTAREFDENGREMENMKFTCWRLDKRGLLGETGLHVCLLMATQVHTCLAKR
jgi:transient receptor potential cation channel subfamily V protein 5